MLMHDAYPIELTNVESLAELLCPMAYYSVHHPRRTALWEKGNEISYGDLNEQICGAVLKLNERPRPHRIALLCTNPASDIVWLFAAFRLSVPVLLLNPRLPDDTIVQIFDQARVDLLISDCDVNGATTHSISCEIDALSEPTPKEEQSLSWQLNQPALMVQTSGSSGRPKIAVLSLKNLVYGAIASNSVIPVDNKDRWMLSLPLYHVAGLGILFRSLLAGASVSISSHGAAFADSLGSSRATHVSVVATQLQRLVDQCDPPPKTVREVLVGGGPIPHSLVNKAVGCAWPVRTTYGMTEMSSQIATSSIWLETRPRYSCGEYLPGVDVSIQEDGEIWVRGPAAFAGYLSEDGSLPGQSEDWIRTGDLGSLRNGELFVSGRLDEMFVSGGENIQPEEIEELLLAHSTVMKAAVVPVEDSEFGWRPVAFIEPTERPFSESDLVLHLKSRLPSFKVPKNYFPWPEDDPSAGIKVDRQWLKKRGELLVNESQ